MIKKKIKKIPTSGTRDHSTFSSSHGVLPGGSILQGGKGQSKLWAVDEGRLSTVSFSWFYCPKFSPAELERGCYLGGVETSVLVGGIPLTGQEIPLWAGVVRGVGGKHVLCCHLSPPAELCLLRKRSLWRVDVAQSFSK